MDLDWTSAIYFGTHETRGEYGLDGWEIVMKIIFIKPFSDFLTAVVYILPNRWLAKKLWLLSVRNTMIDNYNTWVTKIQSGDSHEEI